MSAFPNCFYRRPSESLIDYLISAVGEQVAHGQQDSMKHDCAKALDHLYHKLIVEARARPIIPEQISTLPY